MTLYHLTPLRGIYDLDNCRKELLANLLTMRLTVALVCVVAVSALSVFIGSVDYSLRIDAHYADVSEYEAQLDAATTWSQIEPAIILLPQPLSILCTGAEKSHGNRFNINMWNKAGGGGWGYGIVDSGLMKTLVQIDFATVVAIVLSFLAIALGYDAISGERESGTLRQVLVNPIPRGVLLAGKLLWGCLSLWIPFTTSCDSLPPTAGPISQSAGGVRHDSASRQRLVD